MSSSPGISEKSPSCEARGHSSRMAVAAIQASAGFISRPADLRSLRRRAHTFASSGPVQTISYCSIWRASSFFRRSPALGERAVPELLQRLKGDQRATSTDLLDVVPGTVISTEDVGNDVRVQDDQSERSFRSTSRPSWIVRTKSSTSNPSLAVAFPSGSKILGLASCRNWSISKHSPSGAFRSEALAPSLMPERRGGRPCVLARGTESATQPR